MNLSITFAQGRDRDLLAQSACSDAHTPCERAMNHASAPAPSRWVATFAVGFVSLYPGYPRLGAVQLARMVYRLAPDQDPLAVLQQLVPNAERQREVIAASRHAVLEVAASMARHREALRRSELAIEESVRLLQALDPLV